jgi:hypothetical protein
MLDAAFPRGSVFLTVVGRQGDVLNIPGNIRNNSKGTGILGHLSHLPDSIPLIVSGTLVQSNCDC